MLASCGHQGAYEVVGVVSNQFVISMQCAMEISLHLFSPQ